MASCFVDDERVRTALDVLTLASEEGFQKAVMVAGSDRLETFTTLTAKYNGDLYDLEEIQVISRGLGSRCQRSGRHISNPDEERSGSRGLPHLLPRTPRCNEQC